MPRQARKRSESGIYHAMLRGINQQNIFDEDADYFVFLQALQEARDYCNIELFAYCLMGNHVHLLFRSPDNELETFFKKLAGKYVYWYNVKYQRSGHLFQDRFRSEPVENDSYFLTVLRYIHQNPVKAGICKRAEQYPYSSYNAYISQDEVVDTTFALSLIGEEEYVRYMNMPNEDVCMELRDSTRRAVTDEQARALIHKIAHCDSVTQFQNMDSKWQAVYVKKLYEKGISLRQLSRLTGITKGLIERWIKS